MEGIKVKKRIALIIFIVSLLFIVPSYADSNTDAKLLNDFGILSGSDKGFELEKPLTKLQTGILLSQIIKSKNDLNYTEFLHTYKDVPKWADKYVEFIYRKKLIPGTSINTFGINDKVSEKEFSSWLLNLLGYDYLNGDYKYENAADFAHKLGIQAQIKNKNQITRGEAATLIISALKTKVNKENISLFDKYIPAVSEKDMHRVVKPNFYYFAENDKFVFIDGTRYYYLLNKKTDKKKVIKELNSGFNNSSYHQIIYSYLSDNFLYFNEAQTNKLYRMDIENNKFETVGEYSNYILTYGNYGYYLTSRGSYYSEGIKTTIYRYNLLTKNSTALLDIDGAFYPEDVSFYENKMFFTPKTYNQNEPYRVRDDNFEQTLCYVDLETLELFSIKKAVGIDYVINNNKVYFVERFCDKPYTYISKYSEEPDPSIYFNFSCYDLKNNDTKIISSRSMINYEITGHVPLFFIDADDKYYYEMMRLDEADNTPTGSYYYDYIVKTDIKTGEQTCYPYIKIGSVWERIASEDYIFLRIAVGGNLQKYMLKKDMISDVELIP